MRVSELGPGSAFNTSEGWMRDEWGREYERQNDRWSRHRGGMFGGREPTFLPEGCDPTGRAFSHPSPESSSSSPTLFTSHPNSPPSLIFPLFPSLFIALPSPDTPPSVSPFLLAALLPSLLRSSLRWWQNFPCTCCADEHSRAFSRHTPTNTHAHTQNTCWMD